MFFALLLHEGLEGPVSGDDLRGEGCEESLDLCAVDGLSVDGDGLRLVVGRHVRGRPGKRLAGVIDTTSLEPFELAQINKNVTF